MPCYHSGATAHKPYECSYCINRIQCNNCNRTGPKALVFCPPQQRGRGRTTFHLRYLTHTQRGTPSSFLPRRVSSGRFNRFLSAWSLRFAPISVYRRVLVYLIGSHNSHDSERSPIQYTVKVNGLQISMEVDSGSCYSLLNSDWWNLLGRPVLRLGPILKKVSQNIIPVLGIANFEVRLNNQYKQLCIVFLDRSDTASLLGRE